jgi:hypothetical protein
LYRKEIAMREAAILLRLSGEEKFAIERAAFQDRRSSSDWIRLCIEDKLSGRSDQPGDVKEVFSPEPNKLAEQLGMSTGTTLKPKGMALNVSSYQKKQEIGPDGYPIMNADD